FAGRRRRDRHGRTRRGAAAFLRGRDAGARAAVAVVVRYAQTRGQCPGRTAVTLPGGDPGGGVRAAGRPGRAFRRGIGCPQGELLCEHEAHAGAGMSDVFVTRRIPRAGLEVLDGAGAAYTVGQHDDEGALPRAGLIAGAQQADVLLTLLTERIDHEVLAANPRLRGVAN